MRAQLALGTSFSFTTDLDFLRLASSPVIDACRLLATPAEAGYGYRIELRGEFVYEMRAKSGKILSEKFEGIYG